MSITREKALRILDGISQEWDRLEQIPSSTEDDFGKIHRVAFIEYKGVKGRLIWDYYVKNEITFIENVTGKHFSLGKNINDSEVNEVFYYLANKYEKDNHRLASEVVIVYDSEKAKETVKKLYKYLCFKKKLSTIILNIKEYEHLKEKKQIKAKKEIIFGHHSWAKDKIKKLGGHDISRGMWIDYDNHTCVLRADRSKYPYGTLGKMQFKVEYQRKMQKFKDSANELGISIDFDDNKKTTMSMYNFLLTAVVKEGFLDAFLKSKYTDNFVDKRAELCGELQKNPKYPKYITSDILEKICKRQKFLTDKGTRVKSAWRDLYKLADDWYIQQYWIKDYYRIYNRKYQDEVYGTVEQILCPILEHCRRQELKEKITRRDWGIVFCGGGGKGAYQIGVWKWLKEHGIADKITGVSGASVGALNSLLFVEGNYELAEKIWNSVRPRTIMKQQPIPVWQDQDDLSNILEERIKEMKNICTSKKLVYSALTCTNGIPLKETIEHLKNGVALNTSTIRADYFCWASRKKEEIQEIVLASAAIPVIKKIRKFEGKEFVDGGLADNVPIQPLVEDGFRNIIVVHLDDNEKAFQKSIANLKNTANVNFYRVKPTKSLGSMEKAGQALTKARIELGEKDAAEQLAKILRR